ncbi:VRR-NUC domain-containing protein [Vibrio sp.]|uniref:VRR-NUC domain-containing protein n=1 Tax=Vibrio sp. TaxID=678 RepID=UPI003D095B20
MQPSPTLAPDYYLNNFVTLVQHAHQWYSDLLTDSEHQWLERFAQLDHPSQCLLVRMLARKGCWFRSDKLSYSEIGPPELVLQNLHRHGFVQLNPSASFTTLAQQLLTKTELLGLCPELPRSLAKSAMVEQLTDQVFDHYHALNFTVIELRSSEILNLLLLLFFANTRQDLTQFVLDELGLHQFEPYLLSRQRRFFPSRDDVDRLLQISQLSEQAWLLDRKDPVQLFALLNQVPSPTEHDYVERKRQHLINHLARDLERVGEYSAALDWFSQTLLPPSRERRARILDKLDQNDQFESLVQDMLTAPKDRSEYEVAEKLLVRVQRKAGQKVPRSKKPSHDTVTLSLDLSQSRVEVAVREYYQAQGWSVHFVENAFLNGLFGLAFWPVLFAPVEGAFINPYQTAPKDLYHNDFADKRRELIDQVFESLGQSGYQIIKQRYQQKSGISNSFVAWPLITAELIDQAEACLPVSRLCQLFRVLLSDLKLYRNGMPDLIAFKDGQCRWIEVKGPGDKLQDNQWRWIAECNRLGMPLVVCYVNQ